MFIDSSSSSTGGEETHLCLGWDRKGWRVAYLHGGRQTCRAAAISFINTLINYPSTSTKLAYCWCSMQFYPGMTECSLWRASSLLVNPISRDIRHISHSKDLCSCWSPMNSMTLRLIQEANQIIIIYEIKRSDRPDRIMYETQFPSSEENLSCFCWSTYEVFKAFLHIHQQ